MYMGKKKVKRGRKAKTAKPDMAGKTKILLKLLKRSNKLLGRFNKKQGREIANLEKQFKKLLKK